MGLTNVKGSCLCGEIVYEVDIDADRILNCHCTRCQKAHGAAFATVAFAKGETLKFLKGESVLQEYKNDSGRRAFCSLCGSRLMAYTEDKTRYLGIVLACVDGSDDLKVAANICIETKPAWSALDRTLPCFEEIPADIWDQLSKAEA